MCSKLRGGVWSRGASMFKAVAKPAYLFLSCYGYFLTHLFNSLGINCYYYRGATNSQVGFATDFRHSKKPEFNPFHILDT